MIDGAKKMPDPITLPTMSSVASSRPRPLTSAGPAGAAVVRSSAKVPRFPPSERSPRLRALPRGGVPEDSMRAAEL